MTPTQPRHKDKGSDIDAVLNHLFGFTNTMCSEVGVPVNTRYATEGNVTEVTSSEREGESKPHPLSSILNSQQEPVGYLRVTTGVEPKSDKKLLDFRSKNCAKLSTVQKRRFDDLSDELDMVSEGNTRPETTASPRRKHFGEAPSIEKRTSTNIASPSTSCPYELFSKSSSHRDSRRSILTPSSKISSSPVAEMTDYGAEPEDCIPLSPKKSPSRALHERAVKNAIRAVNDMASNGVLQARQRLLQTRKQSTNDVQRPPYTSPKVDGINRQDVTKHINEIKGHLKHLCIDSHLKALVDRVRHLMIVPYYEGCEQASRELREHAIIGRSLHAFFTETWFYDWTEKLQKAKKANTHDSKKEKWKAKLRIGRFWQKLSSRYGSGIIWVLPMQLSDTNILRLTNPDIDLLMALIDEKYPNSKENLKPLSEFTSFLIFHSELPQERLQLELLDEDVIKNTPDNFGELLWPAVGARH